MTALGGTTALTGGLGILNLTLTGTADPSYISFDTNTGRVTALATLPVGVYYETITATDFVGITGKYNLTITVDSLTTITGNSVINTTFDTGSVTIWTFALGTGPLNAKVTGQFASGITWDTGTAGTAKLTITQYMPLGTLFETITVTDSVGATVSKALTLNFLKGNRSLTETALATTIKYGDTNVVSGVNYNNGNTCSYKIVNMQNGYTYVQFESTTACNWTVPAGVANVDVLAVGGGGGGSVDIGGAGGGGEVRIGTAVSVTAGAKVEIKVGAGGSRNCWIYCGNISAGDSTTISGAGLTFTANGGGFGTATNTGTYHSLGGAAGTGGSGGTGYSTGAGGYGVRSGPGVNNCLVGTVGGTGTSSSITGTSRVYGDGGGGGLWVSGYTAATCGYLQGGSGNGGTGAGHTQNLASGTTFGTDGVANTGSGGGAGSAGNDGNPEVIGVSMKTGGGNGSAGVVVIRFATPAPYATPLVDGNLTYRTSTPNVCSVDTNTGAVAAYGSIGTCSIIGEVPEGQYYLAESATINITVGKADTLVVTSYVSQNTLNFNNSMAAITESFTVVGLKAGDTITGVATPVKYNFTGGLTCATGGTCTLGQTGPGGGIVFYDAGSTQTWGRYLEIAPTGWYGTTETLTTGSWCSVNRVETATLTGIGDGYANSVMLASSCGSASNAATMARSYSGGGYSDWYLPSYDEAAALLTQDTLTGINIMSQGGVFYYTSTQNDSSNAYTFNPNGNNIPYGLKTQTKQVRAIRAFDTNILPSTLDTPTIAGKYTVTPSNLTLANAKPLTNYQGVVYVSDTNTGKFTINKVSQSALKVDPVEFAITSDSITLLSIGGTSAKATTFKITSIGSTAAGCTLNGNKLSATGVGICSVYAVKPADVNYYPVISPVISIKFDTFSVRVTITVPLGGGNMIITGGAPVLDTSTPVPTETLTVISFSPTSGSPGTVITIIGTGFVSAGYSLQSVRIGRNLTNVPIKSVSNNTTILATVDTASSSGRITLTFVATNGGTQEFVAPGGVFSFTPAVVASQPTISSFTPTSGVAGTAITITGTNFTGTTRVTIGGSPVDTFTINSSTSITAYMAVGSAAGTIAVTNAAGTGASSGSFTTYNTAPNITLSSSSVTADSVTAVSITVASNSGGPAASYNLLGTLPLGLTFNSSTGAISGTPQEARATSTYTVEAINPMGTGTATFTLTTTY